MVRTSDALRHDNQRKQWAKPWHLTELDVLFSVLVIQWASIGTIGLWFRYPWFVTSYDLFKQIWIVVDVIQHFLSDGHATGFLVKIQQSWNELRCHTLQTQNIRKNCMAWDNRYADILINFSNSDSTILHNNFLQCFSVSIGCWRAGPSKASVVIHLFSTFCEELVPLVNTFLTYSTPYATFNISSVFEHLIPFFTKNLMHILWSIFFDSRKSPTHAKHFWPLCLSQTNKQTKNAILLKLLTYIRDKCADIGKKIENRMYIAREIWKFTLFSEHTSYITYVISFGHHYDIH